MRVKSSVSAPLVRPTGRRALVLTALVSLASPMLTTPAFSQANPAISLAAEKLNTITPQAVAQQTIRVGVFDGGSQKFSWYLHEENPLDYWLGPGDVLNVDISKLPGYVPLLPRVVEAVVDAAGQITLPVLGRAPIPVGGLMVREAQERVILRAGGDTSTHVNMEVVRPRPSSIADYRLGPGDVLDIQVGMPTPVPSAMRVQAVVDNAGQITVQVPLLALSPIPVGGLTVQEAQVRVAQRVGRSITLTVAKPKPARATEINSFNVKYEFELRKPPANFQLTLRVPDATGQIVDRVATLNPAGNVASVTFNPSSMGYQFVTIRPSNLGSLRIAPRLTEQLGAFVVPYMLIGLVYSPPGDFSTASYSRTTIAGTKLSWSFTRTSGIWQTMDRDSIRDMFAKVGSGILSFIPGADKAGSALTAINDVLGHTDVEKTQTTTTGVSGSKAWSFSITDVWGTNDNEGAFKYPGQNDRFIILRDVLFVYMVRSGKVYLAPVAFSKPAVGYMAYELKNNVPPDLADRFLALDPLVGNKLEKFRLQPKLHPASSGSLQGDVLGEKRPRFVFWDIWACQHAPNQYMITREVLSSTGSSEVYSETTVEKATGLQALTGGGGTNVYGYSTSSSIEQVTGDAEVSEVDLKCGANDGPSGFEVLAYVDNVYRTFVTVPGKPLPGPTSPPPIAGRLTNEQGMPIAKQKVSLIIGDRRYSVFSDDRGNFAFPFGSLPRGSGTLQVGKVQAPVSYAGAPVKDLKLSVRRSLLPGGRKKE